MGRYEVTWSELVCYRLNVEAENEDDAVRVARLHVENGEWVTSGGMNDINVSELGTVDQ